MWNLDGYTVIKTTTDKLESILNGFTEGWEVEQITHVGGRDWVVIARMEFDNQDDKVEWMKAEAIA